MRETHTSKKRIGKKVATIGRRTTVALLLAALIAGEYPSILMNPEVYASRNVWAEPAEGVTDPETGTTPDGATDPEVGAKPNAGTTPGGSSIPGGESNTGDGTTSGNGVTPGDGTTSDGITSDDGSENHSGDDLDTNQSEDADSDSNTDSDPDADIESGTEDEIVGAEETTTSVSTDGVTPEFYIDHFEELSEWDAFLVADEMMAAEEMFDFFPTELTAYVFSSSEVECLILPEPDISEQSDSDLLDLAEEQGASLTEISLPPLNEIQIPVTWESEAPYEGGLLPEGETIVYTPVWDTTTYNWYVETTDAILPTITISNNDWYSGYLDVDIELDDEAPIQSLGKKGRIAALGATPAGFDCPSRYVPEISSMPSVRDQGSHNNCWSYATTGAMEMSLIKNGYEDTSIDLSELQLTYYTLAHDEHDQTDPLGGTLYDKSSLSENLWAEYIESGGNPVFSSQGIFNGVGMISDAAMPMDSASSLPDLGNSRRFEADYTISDYYITNTSDIDSVKQMVMANGAATCGMYMASNYYSNEYNSFYVSSNKVSNHAVVIVGWDDDFDADNFRTTQKPEGDGAWLIRNSYGVNDYGLKGYFWLSYYSKDLTGNSLSFNAEPVGRYDHIYQYDGTNYCEERYYNVPNGTTMANVFTAHANADGSERLDSISVANTLSNNTHYEVDIYRNLVSNRPDSGTLVEGAHVEGDWPVAGAHTVNLPVPVYLNEGERFAVLVKVSSNTSDTVKLPFETTEGGGDWWYRISGYSMANQSWYKKTTTWVDHGAKEYGNFRIKAYTKDVNFVAYTLDADDASWDEGESTRLAGYDGWMLLSDDSIINNEYTYGTPIDYMPLDPVREGYDFLGWFTEPGGAGTPVTPGYTVNKSQVIYACWSSVNDVFYVKPIPDQTYTGSSIKPEVEVYFGTTRLTAGVDYTVAYRNNVNAAYADGSSGPYAIIRGRNQYTDKIIVPFTINKRVLTPADVDFGETIICNYTGRVIQPVPTITWKYIDENGKAVSKKLVKGRDYTLEYEDNSIEPDDMGYCIWVDGAGSFAFEDDDKDYLEIVFYITKKQSINNITAKVKNWDIDLSKPLDYQYTLGLSQKTIDGNITHVGVDDDAIAHTLDISVRSGLVTRPAYLWTSAEDPTGPDAEEYYYRVKEYKNNTAAGTASIVIEGTGALYGTKTINYKINGIPLSRVNLSYNGNGYVYDGNPVEVETGTGAGKQSGPRLTYTYGGKTYILKCVGDSVGADELTGYSIRYSNNVNAGKGTFTITGLGPFAGTLSRQFTIKPYDIEDDPDGLVVNYTDKPERITAFNTEGVPEIPFLKSGAVLSGDELDVRVDGAFLEEGIDYTIQCENSVPNSSMTNDGQMAIAYITGRGNYTGTISQNYIIQPGTLADCEMTAPDRIYKNKAGFYQVKPVVTDALGKKLKEGRDYRIVSYEYIDNQSVRREDILPSARLIPAAGTTITINIATVEGSPYSGTLSCTYRVVQTLISSAKVKIPVQYYTRTPITLHDISEQSAKYPLSQCISVKNGTVPLAIYRERASDGTMVPKPESGAYYQIISYRRNDRIGIASVTIAGVGDYGGTKTIIFRIKKKK